MKLQNRYQKPWLEWWHQLLFWCVNPRFDMSCTCTCTSYYCIRLKVTPSMLHTLAFLCGHLSSAEASGVYHSLSNILTLSRIHHGSIQHPGLPSARQVHEGEWEESWLQPSSVLSKRLCQQVCTILCIFSPPPLPSPLLPFCPLFIPFLYPPLLSPSAPSASPPISPIFSLSTLFLPIFSPFSFDYNTIIRFIGGWPLDSSLLAT